MIKPIYYKKKSSGFQGRSVCRRSHLRNECVEQFAKSFFVTGTLLCLHPLLILLWKFLQKQLFIQESALPQFNNSHIIVFIPPRPPPIFVSPLLLVISATNIISTLQILSGDCSTNGNCKGPISFQKLDHVSWWLHTRHHFCYHHLYRHVHDHSDE